MKIWILILWVVGFVTLTIAESRRLSPDHDASFLSVSTPSTAVDHQLRKRWDPEAIASPETFEAHRQKGAFALCLLVLTDEEAGQAWDPLNREPKSARSQWSGNLQWALDTWFWTNARIDQTSATFTNYGDPVVKMGRALEALRISAFPRTNGGNNIAYSVEHFSEDERYDDGDPVPIDEQAYSVAGREYRCTGAFYRFAINHRDGAIFANSLLNPQWAASENWYDEDVTADELPALRSFSDILAAYWMRDNPDPRHLRYYFANQVTNTVTKGIMARVLKDDGSETTRHGQLPYWPGITRRMDSADGQALLGSPLGMPLAYMLLQYKAELGIKTVEEVTIFRDDTAIDEWPSVQLVFKIKDVPSLHGGVQDKRSVVREHVVDMAKL